MNRILVVDDDQEIRDLLERFLSKSGFEIIEAASGKEAIAILKSGSKPEFVILDMKMPGLSTEDILTEIKKLDRALPLLFLTGSIAEEEYLAVLNKFGYKEDDICSKPIDLFVLLKLVKAKLGIE